MLTNLLRVLLVVTALVGAFVFWGMALVTPGRDQYAELGALSLAASFVFALVLEDV